MNNRKALVIGIDDYTDIPLKCCCNDAESIKDLLANHGNGDPNFEVIMKNNIKTKGELRRYIEECFSGDVDVALFYYAEHGYIDSVGGYLVTPDYSEYDYGVSLQDILNIANKSKCKERIIILDSCHSGFTGSISTETQDTAMIKEGVTILTACRSCETAEEVENHGVFTSLLVDALSGGAADIIGRISVAGIYAYIDKALGSWGQRPLFKTNVSRFTSLRDVETRVNKSTIRKLSELFPNDNYHYRLDPSYEYTNSPEYKIKPCEPYSDTKNVKIFKELQKLESVGLVVPVDNDHMYWAAMNSGSCKLTPLGRQYWRLSKENKL